MNAAFEFSIDPFLQAKSPSGSASSSVVVTEVLSEFVFWPLGFDERFAFVAALLSSSTAL